MENWFRLLKTFQFFGEMPLMGNTRWLQELLGMDFTHLSPSPLPLPSTQAQDIWRLGMPSEGGTDLEMGLKRVAGVAPKTLISSLIPQTVWVNSRSLLWWNPLEVDPGLATVIPMLQATSARRTFPLFEFDQGTASAPDLAEIWGAVDDVVMGGVSSSGLRQQAGYVQFSGQVSTQNSGGFVSIRTRNFEPPYDLSAWQGLRLNLRGDGQRYKLILRDRPAWDGAAYCGSFDTVPGEWQSVEIAFADLIATFRARSIANAQPFNSAQVWALQLMLSKFEYDGALNPRFQPGSFALDMRSISVYQPAKLPPLIAIATCESVAQQYDTLLSTSGLTYEVVLLESLDGISEAWLTALFSTMDRLNAL
ncbi:MAG: CIA30 family protein [Cyanobacteria bacterium]|nr:CIA30 family protein [Cyanobacteriota bacterium]MDA0867017.1 CIA30 family protein [Cyanobacteriota bacterium]